MATIRAKALNFYSFSPGLKAGVSLLKLIQNERLVLK